MAYVPGARRANRYSPCALVTSVAGPPGMASEVIVTVAPGRMARDSSRTTPMIEPVESCASADRVHNSEATANSAVRSLISAPPSPMVRAGPLQLVRIRRTCLLRGSCTSVTQRDVGDGRFYYG